MINIPLRDHVGRYCNPTVITENGRVSSAAFKLYPRDKGYLSSDWLEKLSDNNEDQISRLWRIYLRKIRMGKPFCPDSKIAKLNVGYTKTSVHTNTTDSRELLFLNHADNEQPSYSGIYGLKNDDGDEILQIIADSIVESFSP